MFRDYKEEDRDHVIALLSQGKERGYAEEKKTLWRWEHVENPFRAAVGGAGVCVVHDNKVIGYNGLMPIMLKYGDQYIEGVWSFDTILSPECRGKGYGGKLVDVVKQSGNVVLGLGISDAQESIMRKRGYHVNCDIEQFFFTNRLSGLRDFIKSLIQYVYVFKNYYRRLNKGLLESSVVDASRAPKSIDDLWHQVKDGYTNIVVRDYKYIQWKYGAYPLESLQLILVKEKGVLRGLGVFKKGERLSSLIDYVGPANDSQVMNLIIKTFRQECAHSLLLSCICSSSSLKASLLSFGFRRAKEKPRFYVYSNIDSGISPEKEWFVMGGDSDLV